MGRRISSARFVGRELELAALEAALERATAGGGGVVVVTGEAGIGKSRLVTAFEDRARARGASVLVGECLELAGGELAFAPIVSALRGVVDQSDTLAALDPALRSAAGALWPAAGASPPHQAGDREPLFEAVYRILARRARAQPVVLVVEDVHWIDSSSRDLLAFLVRNARRDRILVVATYRSDELPRGHPLGPFVSELGRASRAERIDLGGMERPEVVEQIGAILGRTPDVADVEAVFSRSEGNPFFVEELLAAGQPASGSLPSSLREVLLVRLDRLSAEARDVLAVAATIGRSVEHRLLADVIGGSDALLEAALSEAIEHHVLLPEPPTGYRFRHALLREAIYEDMLGGRRLALHRVIAETLSAHPELGSLDTGPGEALAHHWYAARDLPAALVASVQAAAVAARMHAYPEALRHLERALGLWPDVPDAATLAGTDRLTLLIETSELAEHAGIDQRALDLALEARRGVDDRVAPLAAARAEARIGHALWNAGRADESLAHLAEQVRLVPEDPPSAERAEALAAYSRLLMLNGAFSEARGYLESALALARPLRARAVQASALNTLAIVYEQLGDRRTAIAAGREGLSIAADLGDGAEMLRAYINGSQAIDNAGRLEEALVMGMEGVDAAHRLGLDRAAGDQLRQQAAWRLIRLARFAEAERVIGPALEGATLAFNVAAARSVAGYLAAVRGDFAAAHGLLEEAWPLMQHTGSLQLIGLAQAWRISLALWRGDLECAVELAGDGLERAGAAEGQLIYSAELYWLAARIEAERTPDERAADRASTVAASLDRAIAAMPGDGAPPEAAAFALLVRGEVNRARGRPDPEPWREAAERFAALRQLYRSAYAHLRSAEALALRGASQREILPPLRAAHALATERGMPPFRREVEALARRIGAPLGERETGRAGEIGLSERELTVLRLVARGRTNRQIGQELFITEKTASAHVSHILLKLGVANRAEAAAVAHRLGLVKVANI